MSGEKPQQSITVSVNYVNEEGNNGLLTFRSSWATEAMPLLQKIREAISEVTKDRKEKSMGTQVDISGTATPVKVTPIEQRIDRLKTALAAETLPYQTRRDLAGLIDAYAELEAKHEGVCAITPPANEYVEALADRKLLNEFFSDTLCVGHDPNLTPGQIAIHYLNNRLKVYTEDPAEAVADQKLLIDFFRSPKGIRMGDYGDNHNMTTGEAAVHFLTKYADDEFEMVLRRAVVGEEPYHSPSVDPSEARPNGGYRLNYVDAAEPPDTTLKLVSDNEVWLRLAEAFIAKGHLPNVAAGNADTLLSHYQKAFNGAGLDLRENSETGT